MPWFAYIIGSNYNLSDRLKKHILDTVGIDIDYMARVIRETNIDWR